MLQIYNLPGFRSSAPIFFFFLVEDIFIDNNIKNELVIININ